MGEQLLVVQVLTDALTALEAAAGDLTFASVLAGSGQLASDIAVAAGRVEAELSALRVVVSGHRALN